MTQLRGCPRCRGYLYKNRDIYGEYRECLYCGYMADVVLPNVDSIRKASRDRREVA